MGLHNELPVYKASYDLLIAIFEFSRHFNKEYKYTVVPTLPNRIQCLNPYPTLGGSNLYITGVTIRVRISEEIKPPIITNANGE